MSTLAYCTVWFVIGVLTYPHIATFHAAIPFVLFCLQPKEVIADGSNYKSYTKRWEQSCKPHAIELHDTSTEGAFVLNP
jgi:hypothetical protein